LRHGAGDLEQPTPTKVKGVYGTYLILVECHHISRKWTEYTWMSLL